MGHWLEDIENKQRRSKQHSRSFKKKISDKKRLIRENYEKNGALFDGFIQTMFELINRVNDLPDEHREPFRKLNAYAKKSKLDNHLHYFYSSRREQKQEFSLLLWLKPSHAKHIRVVYIFVSKHDGFANFEIKENYLIRRRESGDEKDKKKSHEKSERSKDRVHVIYPFAMEKLNRDIALQIIDWLVFSKQLHELPFWTDVPIDEKQFF